MKSILIFLLIGSVALLSCNNSEPREEDVVFLNPTLKELFENTFQTGDSLIIDFSWHLNQKAQKLDVSLVDYDQNTSSTLETYLFETFTPNTRKVNEVIRWKIPDELNSERLGYSLLFHADYKRGSAEYREVIRIQP